MHPAELPPRAGDEGSGTPRVPEEPVGLAAKVEFLRRADSYTPRPSSITAIETHMSWVFLAGELAYKLKKPVSNELLDFGTLEGRRRRCLDEVRLNRRLAPQVYLGIVPLVLTSRRELSLNRTGTPVDWLVRMRRLSARNLLDQRIRDRSAGPELLRPAAELLARFYRQARPVPLDASEHQDRFRRSILETRQELSSGEFGLPVHTITEIAEGQLRMLERLRPVLEGRVREERIIESHGDLRPEHIHLGPPPAIFDCLELAREPRILDPADELSFLAVECERLGSPETGAFFFAKYFEATGDNPPADLLAFYRSYRAFLRAKIAIWHLRDSGTPNARTWRIRTIRYLLLSRGNLEIRDA